MDGLYSWSRREHFVCVLTTDGPWKSRRVVKAINRLVDWCGIVVDVASCRLPEHLDAGARI